MPTLQQLADWVGGSVKGDATICITQVADLSSNNPEAIGFLNQDKYLSQAQSSTIGAIIAQPSVAEQLSTHCIVVDNPHWAYAVIAQRLHPRQVQYKGVHPTASIHESAVLGENVTIGAFVSIQANVRIGDNSVINDRVNIEKDASLGLSAWIGSGVVITQRCELGNHVLVQSNAVIGSDGFGYAKAEDGWLGVPQLGTVRIGNHVDIGANTCIDRGALGDTIIEDGVKLDNLIQVAHNVRIGENTAIAATTAIAGSANIGANCTIAGGVRIVGHIRIADGTHIAMNTSVTHSIDNAGAYAGGTPMDTLRQWRKNAVRFRQLDQLFKRLTQLEKTVKKHK